MAGITDNGFESKRLINVVEDIRSNAVPIFQDLVPPGDVLDTSNSSTIGRLTALLSLPIADLWEVTQQIYTAFDPNAATGIPQDNLYAIGGVTRIPESATTADVYFYGNTGITIPFGSGIISSTTSARYTLPESVTLDRDYCHGVGINLSSLTPNTKYSVFYTIAGGNAYKEISITTGLIPTVSGVYEDFANEITANHTSLKTSVVDGTLYIESVIDFQLLSFYSSVNVQINKVIGVGRVVGEQTGSVEQPANTINTITTPVLGWDSVTNPTQARTGNDRETDEEFRVRFRETKFQRATNIIEALYSALYSLNGVDTIIIYENDTDFTDARGLPPHSFWVIVDGGIDTDVAKAIWLNRPTGIRSEGNTVVNIVDSFGYVREVKFSRPNTVPIYINIDIEANQDFPQDGIEQIKNNLVEYISSLKINEDVVFSRLYTPINKVPGHQVDSLTISKDGISFSMSNIEIGIDERAELVVQNINIV